MKVLKSKDIKKIIKKARKITSKIDKREEEVRWFVRKYIRSNKNFDIFMRHLSPDDVTEILKKALEEGMVLAWEDI
jgi:hypothetical protein